MSVSIFHGKRNVTAAAGLNQDAPIDSRKERRMILNMKRQILPRALTVVLAASAFVFTSCSTTETRISDHPEIFQSLSPSDQALVQTGKIREGMSQNAVWLAWGAPDQKATGVARGRQVETWIYNEYVYANAPYPYPFGPFGYGGYFGGGRVAFHHHGRHRFAIIGDPFYDPFFYSYIPPRVAYPEKTVTFSNGRVISIQILTPPQY
ncbi:MAG: hypothetical protein QOG51_1726 [Verrucomicrobiota bacterium]|jgi:hypothetical protein